MQQQRQQPNSSIATSHQPQYQYNYTPPPNQLSHYNKLFFIADKSCVGYLSGQRAVEFLSTSRLSIEVLKSIWNMAMMMTDVQQQEPLQLEEEQNNNKKNTLDRNRFYVVVRLIQIFQNEEKPIDSNLNVGEGEEGGDDNIMRLPFFEGVNVQEVVMPAQDDQGEGQMQGMAKVQQHTNEGGIPSSTDKKSMMTQQEKQQLEQRPQQQPEGDDTSEYGKDAYTKFIT